MVASRRRTARASEPPSSPTPTMVKVWIGIRRSALETIESRSQRTLDEVAGVVAQLSMRVLLNVHHVPGWIVRRGDIFLQRRSQSQVVERVVRGKERGRQVIVTAGHEHPEGRVACHRGAQVG